MGNIVKKDLHIYRGTIAEVKAQPTEDMKIYLAWDTQEVFVGNARGAKVKYGGAKSVKAEVQQMLNDYTSQFNETYLEKITTQAENLVKNEFDPKLEAFVEKYTKDISDLYILYTTAINGFTERYENAINNFNKELDDYSEKLNEYEKQYLKDISTFQENYISDFEIIKTDLNKSIDNFNIQQKTKFDEYESDYNVKLKELQDSYETVVKSVSIDLTKMVQETLDERVDAAAQKAVSDVSDKLDATNLVLTNLQKIVGQASSETNVATGLFAADEDIRNEITNSINQEVSDRQNAISNMKASIDLTLNSINGNIGVVNNNVKELSEKVDTLEFNIDTGETPTTSLKSISFNGNAYSIPEIPTNHLTYMTGIELDSYRKLLDNKNQFTPKFCLSDYNGDWTWSAGTFYYYNVSTDTIEEVTTGGGSPNTVTSTLTITNVEGWPENNKIDISILGENPSITLTNISCKIDTLNALSSSTAWSLTLDNNKISSTSQSSTIEGSQNIDFADAKISYDLTTVNKVHTLKFSGTARIADSKNIYNVVNDSKSFTTWAPSKIEVDGTIIKTFDYNSGVFELKNSELNISKGKEVFIYSPVKIKYITSSGFNFTYSTVTIGNTDSTKFTYYKYSLGTLYLEPDETLELTIIQE